MLDKFHTAILQLAQQAPPMTTSSGTAKGPQATALPIEVQPGDYVDELRLAPDGPAPPRGP